MRCAIIEEDYEKYEINEIDERFRSFRSFRFFRNPLQFFANQIIYFFVYVIGLG
jgi:hypothetical protein